MEITITDAALEYINSVKTERFPDEPIVMLIADLHSIGSAMSIEIHPVSYFKGNPHFQVLFEKGYNGYPFPIYVGNTLIAEDLLSDRVLIEYGEYTTGRFAGNPRLLYKNPDFE